VSDGAGQTLTHLDLFTAYPYWLDGSAAKVGGGEGIWKVNEEDYANIIKPNLAEQHHAIGFLPQYTPGSDPDRYWFLIEDLRLLQTGSDDDYEDLVIHVLQHPDHLELWCYRGYSIYGFQLVGPQAEIYYDVGLGTNVGPFNFIPEPATLSMVTIGALGVLSLRRRRK